MISVSYITSKLNRLETIKKIDESFADLIHVDLMDGIYVENKNFTIDELKNNFNDTKKELDVHLMVNNPIEYIDALTKLKTKIITFHLDSTNNPIEVINKIKENNILVGVAINPSDDLNILDEYYDLIDYVLIMSVVPGKGGQKFMPEVLNKINLLENKNKLIGIDGGINNETIKYLKDYKIDIYVSGSYICMSDDYNKKINELKQSIE